MHPLAETKFTVYGPFHWAALLAVAAAACLLIGIRRRLTTDRGRRRFDLTLGWFTLGQWVLVQAIELTPWQYDVTRSLPIHICDLTGVIAGLALLTGRRVLRAMLYYWAFVLSSVALVMPELQEGPTHLNFWVFWVPHAMIIALAAYDLVGRRFRPTWRDFGYGYASILVYLGLVLLVDLPWGLDYGYVGYTPPGQPHNLGFLGAWPGRVFKAAVAIAAVMAAFTVPWVWRRKKRAKGGDEKAGTKPPRRRPMIDGLEERISV